MPLRCSPACSLSPCAARYSGGSCSLRAVGFGVGARRRQWNGCDRREQLGREYRGRESVEGAARGKGYDVTLQPGDKAIIYNGVAQGKLDPTFEVWLPSADGPPYDAVKSRVEKIGPWFPRAQLGLAVPDYVAIDSIDQLNAHAAQFSHDGKPTIFGIEPGSGLMKLTGEARVAYALDATVLPSSEAAMLLALERAEKRRQPIIVTLWNPHWVWAKYPMHYLKDPKQVYGQPDAIYAIAKSGFGRAHPDVARWLGAWKMDDQTLGSLMNDIRANGESDPQKGVARWIASIAHG